jgi:precorrin-6B methylase 2
MPKPSKDAFPECIPIVMQCLAVYTLDKVQKQLKLIHRNRSENTSKTGEVVSGNRNKGLTFWDDRNA